MHHTAKPVRKCHGCKLNFVDHCGVFPEPHAQWHTGKCKGYGDEELYQKYLQDQAKHPVDEKKERRRLEAKLERKSHPPVRTSGFRARYH